MLRRRRGPSAGSVILGLATTALAGCTVASLPKFAAEVATPTMTSQRLTSRFVAALDRPTHYVVAGLLAGGRRVLFVHGSPGTWSAYRGYLLDPELAAAARLIAYDRPGYGGTGGAAEPSLAAQATVAAAVLEAEPGAPAVVVGHSLGGPIAARLALDRPDLVAGLVLIAPALDPALERRRWYNVAGSLRAVQRMLPAAWVVSNRELWPLRKELDVLLPRWPNLAARTIVIQGLRDTLVPAANADFAERHLPRERLEVRRYAEHGHFVLWQEPDLVRTAIDTLLSEPRTPS